MSKHRISKRTVIGFLMLIAGVGFGLLAQGAAPFGITIPESLTMLLSAAALAGVAGAYRSFYNGRNASSNRQDRSAMPVADNAFLSAKKFWAAQKPVKEGKVKTPVVASTAVLSTLAEEPGVDVKLVAHDQASGKFAADKVSIKSTGMPAAN